MACEKCKQKDSGFKDELDRQTSAVSKVVLWVMVVWSLLAVYGLYTLISKVI